MCYNNFEMKNRTKGLSILLIAFFAVTFGLSLAVLCPGTCEAEAMKCRMEPVQEPMPCHEEEVPDCSCLHQLAPAALKGGQFLSFQFQKSSLQWFKVKSFAHKGILLRVVPKEFAGAAYHAPPGHVLFSLLSFLSSTEHSPPVLA